jgi:hypothetical protein
MKILFVNGPRQSGKDTAVKFLVREFGCRTYKMAGPMKGAAPELLGISHDDARVYFEDPAAKLRPHKDFFGMSPVQWLIWLSEEVMKPKFGKDYFGRIAVRNLSEPTQSPFTAISDCGFRDECIPLVRTFGPRNCHVFQLHRPGKTYDGDSRGYLELTDLGVPLTEIRNEYTLDVFKMQVEELTRKWLNELDSK